jgi:hypothetical protein
MAPRASLGHMSHSDTAGNLVTPVELAKADSNSGYFLRGTKRQAKLGSMDPGQTKAADARTLALGRVQRARGALRVQKGARALLLRRGANDLAVRRANHRVWWSAGVLVDTVERFRPHLGAIICKEMLAEVQGLPPPKLCECACRGFVLYSTTGRPPRFATVACRKRAYRRRHAGLPEDAPETKSGGRSNLAVRLEGWLWSEMMMAYTLEHRADIVRAEARRRYGLSGGRLRNYLKWLRIEAGLRPRPLDNIRSSRYSTRSIQV